MSKKRKLIVIGMVGLVGSGKSSIARVLAKHLKANVIDGNAIFVQLRKEKIDYSGARNIAEALVREYLKRGRSVVIDSDFIDAKKRSELVRGAKKFGARVMFVRVYVNPDVAIGRMMTARYRNQPDDFFGGAATKWHGKPQKRGAVVKIREMLRRTPHHYRWSEKGGGTWMLKNPPFVDFSVDTTDGKTWKQQVREIARKLKK